MKTCPNDPTHLVRATQPSINMFYNYCTICREDVEHLAKLKGIYSMKPGIFLNNDQSDLLIDLKTKKDHSWNWFINGMGKSGKSSVANSLIHNHLKKYPKAKIIILNDKDEYKEVTNKYNGKILSQTEFPMNLKKAVDRNQILLIQIKKDQQSLVLVENMLNQIVAEDNVSEVDGCLYVLDIESMTSKLKDTNVLTEFSRLNRTFNRQLIFVNSDPLFRDWATLDKGDLNYFRCNLGTSLFCGGYTRVTVSLVQDEFLLKDEEREMLNKSGIKVVDGKNTLFSIFKKLEIGQGTEIFHKI
jgi:hypothetical protein